MLATGTMKKTLELDNPFGRKKTRKPQIKRTLSVPEYKAEMRKYVIRTGSGTHLAVADPNNLYDADS